MKIYTRKGDSGTTELIGQQSVSKTDNRVQALGCLDELSASLGVARAIVVDRDLQLLLAELQADLHVVATIVATTATASHVPPNCLVHETRIAELEQAIDLFTSELQPLRAFVAPGGTLSAAHLHLARAVARRCERECVLLASELPANCNVLPYLNRLSDLLFVLARACNKRAGRADLLVGKL